MTTELGTEEPDTTHAPETPTQAPTPTPPPGDEGLSDGEIAAIVICSCAGAAAIGGGGYMVYKKR